MPKQVPENLQILWSKVEKSDPDSVKEVKYGARKFNSVDAHSQIKKATEVFGIYGEKWGVKEERFYNIGQLIVYQAIFFYEYSGHVGEFPIASSINPVQKFGNDQKIDDECIKKVATDALTKGLSKLGFNSDVFENKFMDNRYVQELKEEKAKSAQKENEDDIKLKIAELLAKAEELANKGDVAGVTTIWNQHPEYHKADGFRSSIGELGKIAKSKANA